MRSATRDSWVVTAGSVLIAVLVIVFWEILSKNLFVIPAPGATFHAFVKLYGSGDLTAALAATFRNGAVAFILSVIVGAILGVLIGRSQYWYEVLNPMIVAGNGIPKIILYPLILLIFGLNPRAMVAMGFIHGFFRFSST